MSYLEKYKAREAKEYLVIDQDGQVLSVCNYSQAEKWARAKNAAIYLNEEVTAAYLVKDYRALRESKEALAQAKARKQARKQEEQPQEPGQVQDATPVEEWTEADTARFHEIEAQLKADGDLPWDVEEELTALKKKYERCVE